MQNETFTPHTPDSDDLDSPEWSEEFERRYDHLMALIEDLIDSLINGTVTRDARTIDNYSRMLCESFVNLEDFTTLCEPGLKSCITLAAYDFLYCGYQLGRRSKAHPEIAYTVKQDNAHVARTWRKMGDDARASKLSAAIINVSKGASLSNDWSFAESIRLDVWAELREMGFKTNKGDYWRPDTRTIRRRISAILLERR